MRLGSAVFSLALLSTVLAASPARAADYNTGYPWNWATAKAQAKQATKWSLGEWLAAKNQMKLMDMWLVMHSPTPYEFYIGMDYRSAARPNGSGGATRFQLGAFAHAFGITGERDQLEDRWEARFNVRLFGFQQQGTHWLVGFGIRADGEPQAQDSLLYTELDLYLAKAFGVEFSYRRDFGRPTTRWTIGPHLDFAFVRLYGEYFRLDREVGEDLSGWNAGVRLYF